MTARPRRTARRRTTAAALGAALVLAPLGVVLTVATPARAATTCSGVPHDVDGDGVPEVAIGEPGGGASRGGRVHVLFGGQGGPTTSGTPNDLLLAQGVGGVPGNDVAGDRFGAAVAWGDVDADGCADLAVGVPGNNRGCGAVVVLYGRTDGTFAAPRLLTQDTAWGVTRSSAPCSTQGRAGEHFGAALAVGDYNADGFDDLAVGAPDDRGAGGAGRSRGAVSVLLGERRANAFASGKIFTQDSPRVSGAAEDGDRFGAALASVRSNLLAVGVPGENRGAGLVQVLPGGCDGGICAVPDTAFSQDTPGVPGAAEPGDRFGAALASGDVNGDATSRLPREELVVGAPGENAGAGVVTVLYADPSANPVAVGAQAFSQDTPGVAGVAAARDGFGSSVAVARLDSDASADIVIGAPRDAVNGVADAGSVTVVRGSAGGISTAGYGGDRYAQGATTTGLPEAGDRFGASVAAQDRTAVRDGFVLVGSPGESFGTTQRVGAVYLKRFSVDGPSAGGTGLEPDTAGLLGTRRADGAFGAALD